MPTIQELRTEKRRLIAEIKQVRLDVASGLRPSRAQVLNAIVIEANTNAEIQ